MSKITVSKLLSNITSITDGLAIEHNNEDDTKSFQATVKGAGLVTATVLIQATLNGIDWLTLGTITLSGTSSASDGFSSSSSWAAFKAKVTAISGTGATVTVLMGG